MTTNQAPANPAPPPMPDRMLIIANAVAQQRNQGFDTLAECVADLEIARRSLSELEGQAQQEKEAMARIAKALFGSADSVSWAAIANEIELRVASKSL